MIQFRSVNPKNGQLLKTYSFLSNGQLEEKVVRAHKSYMGMKAQGNAGLQERLDKLGVMQRIMGERKAKYAETMSHEVGKLLRESTAEIEKCIGF